MVNQSKVVPPWRDENMLDNFLKQLQPDVKHSNRCSGATGSSKKLSRDNNNSSEVRFLETPHVSLSQKWSDSVHTLAVVFGTNKNESANILKDKDGKEIVAAFHHPLFSPDIRPSAHADKKLKSLKPKGSGVKIVTKKIEGEEDIPDGSTLAIWREPDRNSTAANPMDQSVSSALSTIAFAMIPPSMPFIPPTLPLVAVSGFGGFTFPKIALAGIFSGLTLPTLGAKALFFAMFAASVGATVNFYRRGDAVENKLTKKNSVKPTKFAPKPNILYQNRIFSH